MIQRKEERERREKANNKTRYTERDETEERIPSEIEEAIASGLGRRCSFLP